MCHEFFEDFHSESKLLLVNVLIRGVGLIDGPRATDDGRYSSGKKLSGLGRVGYRPERIVSGQLARKRLSRIIPAGKKGRDIRQTAHSYTTFREPGGQCSVDLRHLFRKRLQKLIGIDVRRASKVKLEPALSSQNVDSRASFKCSDADRGMGWCHGRVSQARRCELCFERPQIAEELDRLTDSGDAKMRQARMCFPSSYNDLIEANALMRGNNFPECGFPNPYGGGLGASVYNPFDHGRRALTADFFIVRKGKMHRVREVQLGEAGCESQAEGYEAFHVRGSPSIKSAANMGQYKWIGDPVLSIDRNDVGMTREDESAGAIRAESCPKIGFISFAVWDSRTPRAQRLQLRLEPVNQIEI